METTEREILARVLWGGRWAALATHGDGVPLASMVAYACELERIHGGESTLRKRFPDSSLLFGFGDFLLFRLVPREARFVAGFARAYTIDAEELKKAAAVRLDP